MSKLRNLLQIKEIALLVKLFLEDGKQDLNIKFNSGTEYKTN
jgi:hypothetical protein